MGQRDTILIALSKIKGIGLKTINQLPEAELSGLKNARDLFNYVNSNPLFKDRVIKTYSEIIKAYNVAEIIKEESYKAKIEIITKFDEGKYPERFKKL